MTHDLVTPQSSRPMSGAEFVSAALVSEGVDRFFMVPGGHNDPFMPAMSRTRGLQTLVAAHEGGAAYMADGYSRATGRLGVAFGIGGPGLTNMTTALASARVDRSAVVAISGEVPTTWEGQGGFQDASGPDLDDVALMRTVCAFSTRVESPVTLAPMLREALTTAAEYKLPVHMSIPLDVQRAPQTDPWRRLPTPLDRGDFIDENALDRAFHLLSMRNQNVVMLAGAGVRQTHSTEALRAAAEHWAIPVATTLAGKGLLPEDHPLALGVFGYGGNRWATEALLSGDVDVLIVLGSALTQRDTLQWNPRMLPKRALIHVGADPINLSRTWTPDVAVFGALGTFLHRLVRVDGAPAAGLAAGRNRRAEFLAQLRTRGPFAYDVESRTNTKVPLHPAAVIHAARKACPRETVAVVDSGAHRAFCAQHWTAYSSQDYVSATNLGPMGAALPIGIGSVSARPEIPHVVFVGDGCMLMHGMELHTAARYGLPLIVVVMNNQSYGNIWYRAHEMGPAESTLTDIPGIDWVGLGAALGVATERVRTADDLQPAFERALVRGTPCLVDARIDKTAQKPTAPWTTAVQEWEDDH